MAQNYLCSMLVASQLETFITTMLEHSPVRQDQANRKERVIAATLHVCARKGSRSFNVADIAEEASVSTASIYKDFLNGEDVLTHAILRAFEILEREWAHDQIAPSGVGDDASGIVKFLEKLCETYSNPISSWLLHLDLAAIETPDVRVREAHIRFQDRTIEYGIKALPSGQFGVVNPHDLVQMLIGTLQLQIVFALLNDVPKPGKQPNADALDLTATIKETVAWFALAPGVQNPKFVARPQTAHATLGQLEYPKSDVQLCVEDILARPLSRTDRVGRNQKILAATMQHCAAHGIEAAKVTQIAKLAGVSTASVYRVFADKTALVHASIYHFLPTYAQATMRAVEEPNPHLRLQKLLIAQALIVSDPFGAWLFRYIVDYGTHRNDEIKAFSQMARTQSDLFWNDQIRRLEREGYLMPTDVNTTRNMIYGGVQRRCILARALHQNDAHVWSEIHNSAKVGVDLLFRLYGTGRSPYSDPSGSEMSDLVVPNLQAAGS